MNNVVNHSERAHSSLGASSASRWMNCPGSVALSEGLPNPSSDNAKEGTCAHELVEVALLGTGKCRDYVGEVYEGFTVTEEMADYSQVYVDYVTNASEAAGEGSDTLIEERFSLAYIREGMFGTNDACILEPFGTLEIIDLKYGKGVEVEAVGNKQLMYYALGAAQGGDFANVKLTIIQPRVENPIKSSTISFDELKAFEAELKAAVKETEKANATLATGDHCRWCLAKAICPARKQEAQELAVMDFSSVTNVTTEQSLPQADKLNVIEIKNILNHSKAIKEWLDSVAAYAQQKMENGGHVDGYKLVKGRSIRKYSSEADIITEFGAVFGEDIYAKRKLIGIPAMEKIVGKEALGQYIYKPEGKITMAKREDKRAEYFPKPLFDGFTDEDKAIKELPKTDKNKLINDCLDDFQF